LASFAPEDRKAIVCVRAIGVTADICTFPNAPRATLTNDALAVSARLLRGES
jgi:hypothetical protein